MRWIRKGQEPKSWTEYRLSTPGATYESAPKEDLRRALLAEQGYLCCYCMRSIDERSTRIEHRLPRETYGEMQFDYRNLLAACDGGEGSSQEHCDVHKHSTKITVDPAHPTRNVEDLITYSSDGKIDSKDEAIRSDLNETLNLNLDWMKEARNAALDGFRDGFERKHKKAWSVDSMSRELKKWADVPPRGKLNAYAGVVAFYLRKRLHRVLRR